MSATVPIENPALSVSQKYSKRLIPEVQIRIYGEIDPGSLPFEMEGVSRGNFHDLFSEQDRASVSYHNAPGNG